MEELFQNALGIESPWFIKFLAMRRDAASCLSSRYLYKLFLLERRCYSK